MIDPMTLVWVIIILALCFIFRNLITLVVIAVGAVVIAALGATVLGVACGACWLWRKVKSVFKR